MVAIDELPTHQCTDKTKSDSESSDSDGNEKEVLPQRRPTAAPTVGPNEFIVTHLDGEKSLEKPQKSFKSKPENDEDVPDLNMKQYVANFIKTQKERREQAKGLNKAQLQQTSRKEGDGTKKAEELAVKSKTVEKEEKPYVTADILGPSGEIPAPPPVTKKRKEWIDVAPNKDRTILKGIRREGYGPFCPTRWGKKGDTVFVHYSGRVKKTGKTFRNTYHKDKPFALTLGNAMVAMRKGDYKTSAKDLIPFWEFALPTMRKGEKATFVVKPEYAYAAEGLPHKVKGEEAWVPPNSTVIYDVELVRWEGEDLLPSMDKTILKSVIVKGSQYGKVNIGGTVEAHIMGWYKERMFLDRVLEWECGEIFDLGLPEGLDEAVQHMTTGERSWIQLKFDHCYGSSDNKEFGLPRFADLDFDVTILKQERAPEGMEMDKEDRIQKAEKLKKKGTQWFQRGNFKMAEQKFDAMWELLADTTEFRRYGECELSVGTVGWSWYTHKGTRDELWQAAHLNLALCALKLENNKTAIDHCDRVIKEFPMNAKAHYRKGQALQILKEFNEAIKCYKEVLSIDPDNELAMKQIQLCRLEHEEQKEKQKKAFGNFFKNDEKSTGEAKRETNRTKKNVVPQKNEPRRNIS